MAFQLLSCQKNICRKGIKICSEAIRRYLVSQNYKHENPKFEQCILAIY